MTRIHGYRILNLILTMKPRLVNLEVLDAVFKIATCSELERVAPAPSTPRNLTHATHRGSGSARPLGGVDGHGPIGPWARAHRAMGHRALGHGPIGLWNRRAMGALRHGHRALGHGPMAHGPNTRRVCMRFHG